MPLYSARIVETRQSKPNCWKTTVVGVFNADTQIGSYERNYPSLYNTFFPFEQDGKWYALYSRDYTATRVMSLPDCVDLGGEAPDGCGFCPTEFYVPELAGWLLNPDDPKPTVANHDHKKWAKKVPIEGGGERWHWPDDPNGHTHLKDEYLSERARTHKLCDEWRERNPVVTQYAKWGFVAGCQWGDDSGWKIQYLDLSRVAEGILSRDDRFGYLELPANVTLKDAIYVDGSDYINDTPERMRITIATPVIYDLTGKKRETY